MELNLDKADFSSKFSDIIESSDDGERLRILPVVTRILAQTADILSEQDQIDLLQGGFMMEALGNGLDADLSGEDFAPLMAINDSHVPILLNPEFCRALNASPEVIRHHMEQGTYMSWVYDEDNAPRAVALLAQLGEWHGYVDQILTFRPLAESSMGTEKSRDRDAVQTRWSSFSGTKWGTFRFAEASKYGLHPRSKISSQANADLSSCILNCTRAVKVVLWEEEGCSIMDPLEFLYSMLQNAWMNTPLAMNVYPQSGPSLNSPGYIDMTGYSDQEIQNMAEQKVLRDVLYPGGDGDDVADKVAALNNGEVSSYFASFRLRRKDGSFIILPWFRRRWDKNLTQELSLLAPEKVNLTLKKMEGISFGVAMHVVTSEENFYKTMGL